MLETAIQKLIVDAVNEYGGHAFKAANRFLVGVVDLSIKMSHDLGSHRNNWNPPHAFIEVKKHDIKWNSPAARVTTEITKMQHDFMRDYQLAGGVVGIASFLDGKNVSELRMAMVPFQAGVQRYNVLTSSFTALGKEPMRTAKVIQLLKAHIDG